MQGLIIVMTLSLVGIGSFAHIVNVFYADSSHAFTVNGQGVTKQIFALRASIEKRIVDFYKAQLGDLAPRFLAQAGMDMSPEKNAYNKIVQELVLSSCINRSGLFVSTRALAQKAQDPMTVMNIFGTQLPRALYDRNGKIQQEVLVRILASMGLTIDDFEKMLEGAVQRDLALELFNLATPVTQKEIDVYALKEFGSRDFTLVTYSIDKYLHNARKTEVSSEELTKFFNEKNAQSRAYWTQEKRSGTLWKVPTTEKNKQKVTDAAQQALKGDIKDFDAFIAEYKGQKSQVVDVQRSPKNSMLFQLALDDKGIYHEDNHVVIAMPTKITPAQEKSYQEVEKQVKEDYYLTQAQKALIGDLEGAGVSDEHKTGTQKFTLKPGNLETEIEKLNKKSFLGDRIKNMVIEGKLLRGLNDQGGYLVTLERVERPQTLTPEQYSAARSALLKENERLVTAASVDSLLKNAKINNNKTLE
jgi:hypothetical protein